MLWLRIKRLFSPREQRINPPLGRLDANFPLISNEQLLEAKRVQTQSKHDLGKVLTDFGFADEQEIMSTKAQRLGIGYVDLDRVQIEALAIDSVQKEIAKLHTIFPVERQGDNLWLALADLNDIRAMDAARSASGCRVIPVLAVQQAIIDAISKHYQ